MDRLIKLSALVTTVFFVCASIVTILTYSVTNLSLSIPTNEDYVVVFLLFCSSIIAFMLALRLRAINRERHNKVTQILMFIFLCNGASTMYEVIRGFVKFQDKNFDAFVSNGFYYILCLGTFLTAFFVIEVFYDGLTSQKNKVVLGIIALALISFAGFLFKEVFISAETIEVAIFGLILVITEMYVYVTLTKAAYVQSRRLEDSLARQGYQLIGLGGLTLTLSFILVFLFYILKTIETVQTPDIINWIAQCLIVTSLLLLYTGFTKPMKKKDISRPLES